MAIKLSDDYVAHIEMVWDAYTDLRKRNPQHELLNHIRLFSNLELYSPYVMGSYIFDLRMAAEKLPTISLTE